MLEKYHQSRQALLGATGMNGLSKFILFYQINININNNDNNNNLYFTRVSHSTTGFDFSCGSQLSIIIVGLKHERYLISFIYR